VVGPILGLLPPCGIGCMNARRAGIGVLLIGFWLLSIPLVFVFGIGFLTGFATWVASAVLLWRSPSPSASPAAAH